MESSVSSAPMSFLGQNHYLPAVEPVAQQKTRRCSRSPCCRLFSLGPVTRITVAGLVGAGVRVGLPEAIRQGGLFALIPALAILGAIPGFSLILMAPGMAGGAISTVLNCLQPTIEQGEDPTQFQRVRRVTLRSLDMLTLATLVCALPASSMVIVASAAYAIGREVLGV